MKYTILITMIFVAGCSNRQENSSNDLVVNDPIIKRFGIPDEYDGDKYPPIISPSSVVIGEVPDKHEYLYNIDDWKLVITVLNGDISNIEIQTTAERELWKQRWQKESEELRMELLKAINSANQSPK